MIKNILKLSMVAATLMAFSAILAPSAASADYVARQCAARQYFPGNGTWYWRPWCCTNYYNNYGVLYYYENCHWDF